jgi:hypothetical protein
MDWLRSEDLKEEKNVTAPKSNYSSPSRLPFAKRGGVPLGHVSMNSQYVAAEPCDLSLPSGILLREEPEDEEEVGEKGNDEEDQGNREGATLRAP